MTKIYMTKINITKISMTKINKSKIKFSIPCLIVLVSLSAFEFNKYKIE